MEVTNIQENRKNQVWPEEERKLAELEFNKTIRNIYGRQIQTPLDIIFAELNAENKLSEVSSTEKKFFEFAMLIEIDRILNQDDDSTVSLRNIIEIASLKNKGYFINQSSVKNHLIKKLAERYKFSYPSKILIMQKKQKISKRDIFRPAFVTPKLFGQVRKEINETLYKSSEFKNQEIWLESEETVIRLL